MSEKDTYRKLFKNLTEAEHEALAEATTNFVRNAPLQVIIAMAKEELSRDLGTDKRREDFVDAWSDATLDAEDAEHEADTAPDYEEPKWTH